MSEDFFFSKHRLVGSLETPAQEALMSSSLWLLSGSMWLNTPGVLASWLGTPCSESFKSNLLFCLPSPQMNKLASQILAILMMAMLPSCFIERDSKPGWTYVLDSGVLLLKKVALGWCPRGLNLCGFLSLFCKLLHCSASNSKSFVPSSAISSCWCLVW